MSIWTLYFALLTLMLGLLLNVSNNKSVLLLLKVNILQAYHLAQC